MKLKQIFVILIISIVGLASSSLNAFLLNTGDYLDRLEDLLLFEDVESQMFAKRDQVHKEIENNAKMKVKLDELNKSLKNLEEKGRETERDIKRKASGDLTKLKVKKDLSQTELNTLKDAENAKQNASWWSLSSLIKTGLDLASNAQSFIGETAANTAKATREAVYGSEADAKEKLANDIGELTIKLEDLDEEISKKENELNNIPLTEEYKQAMNEIRNLMKKTKDEIHEYINLMSQFSQALVKKHGDMTDRLINERDTLFKRSKCSGDKNSKAVVRSCKAKDIAKIKEKQPKLRTCKALDIETVNIKQVQECRKEYLATKKKPAKK